MTKNIEVLQAFASSLAGRDPKTVTTYLSTLRGLIDWLDSQPGGSPFRVELLTETAIQEYLNHLQTIGRAPRPRQKALTAIRRFCRWAISQGLLQRNPATQI